MSDIIDPSPYDKGDNIQPIPVPQETATESTTVIPERKDLVLTYISINFLKEIAKWAKFLSILGFIMVGLMVLMGLFTGAIMGFAGSMVPHEAFEGQPNPMNMMGGFMGFFYVIIAAFYFFPVYYLYNFSSKIKSAIQLNSEVALEDALKNLKSHYKFVGIVAVIITVIYGGIFVIFGGIALLAGSMF